MEILSGKVNVGADCWIGEGVVVNVAEEVTIGDRCVIPDNAYLCGRRIEIGDDFFGYQWDNTRLDIGRGRTDEEHAILKVGKRCTFHDNRIDLARPVTIGNDVGLSPEVVVYTHGYWLSPFEGYPSTYAPVDIGGGTIVGFRSVILAGAEIGDCTVIGAQSVVTGKLQGGGVYAGDPAKLIRWVQPLPVEERRRLLKHILHDYSAACFYRGLTTEITWDFPYVKVRGCSIDVSAGTLSGEEDEYIDDLRDFLFKRGVRIYTKRRFQKLRKVI